MRIITSQLRQIIREEITRTLRESSWAQGHDGQTSTTDLIKKLKNSGKDVGGIINFLERDKGGKNDELYVLKKNSHGDVGVYMYSTWPDRKQIRIDIPKDIAMAAGIAYPKL